MKETIEQIALRVAAEADNYADSKLQCVGEYHPDWHEVRDIHYAYRIIEELDKQAEPVRKGCACKWCKQPHSSDCAVHNGPAYPEGCCDCGVAPGLPADWPTEKMYSAGMRYLHGKGTAWCINDLFKAMISAAKEK